MGLCSVASIRSISANRGERFNLLLRMRRPHTVLLRLALSVTNALCSLRIR